MQFDCICLSEVLNCNLDFYKTIFPSYRGCFEKVIDSNIGEVAIFIKKELKSSNTTKDFNIEFSKNVSESKTFGLRITKERSKYIIGTIYRDPKGNVN